MSKIKLLVEIDENKYKQITEMPNTYASEVCEVIRNGTPYNPTGDCISREALKKEMDRPFWEKWEWAYICKAIDNAPTVPLPDFKEGYKQAIIDGKTNYSRLQGECRTCRHRDPEDKKCDCGALERAGCPFPVSDDYFCKFYEKGGVNDD